MDLNINELDLNIIRFLENAPLNAKTNDDDNMIFQVKISAEYMAKLENKFPFIKKGLLKTFFFCFFPIFNFCI